MDERCNKTTTNFVFHNLTYETGIVKNKVLIKMSISDNWLFAGRWLRFEEGRVMGESCVTFFSKVSVVCYLFTL